MQLGTQNFFSVFHSCILAANTKLLVEKTKPHVQGAIQSLAAQAWLAKPMPPSTIRFFSAGIQTIVHFSYELKLHLFSLILRFTLQCGDG
jgi:hypothetical protein